MKKLMAATSDAESSKVDAFVDNLNAILNRVGYIVQSSGTFPEVTLEVTSYESKDEFMPELSLEVKPYEDGYYVLPSLTFMPLTWNEDEYADSIEWHLNNWASIGKAITELNKFTYFPEDEE